MKRFRKYIGYLVMSVLLAFLIISVAGIIVIRLYGDEIKNYVLNSLNNELAVKVELGKVELSAFRRFPHVSIIFEEVIAYSSQEFNKNDFHDIQTDTLFRAGNIFLRFNIIDIIRGRYNIKRIFAEEGELTLLTDKMGSVNYQLLRQTESSRKDGFTLNLELFKLKGFSFNLVNVHKDINASGRTNEILLKGKLGSGDFNLTLIGSLFIETFRRENVVWADNLAMEAHILLNASDSVYHIDRGRLSLNDLKLEASGTVVSGQKIFTDIMIEGQNLDLKSVVNIMPDNLKKPLGKYSPDGRSDIKIMVHGAYTSTHIPSVKAEYSISRGKIKLQGKNSLTGIGFNGSYSNGIARTPRSTSFTFRDITAKTSSSEIKGNVYIENLISPYIKADIGGVVYLPDIHHFFEFTEMNFTAGNFFPELSFTTSLSSFKEFDIKKILTTDLNGQFSINNTSIKHSWKFPHITNLEGKSSIKNDVWVSEIGIQTPSGDILFKGRMDHVLKRFLHNTSSLWIQGNVYSHNADLSFILENDSDEADTSPPGLPEKLFMQLALDNDYFKMGKFSAKQVSAGLNYRPGFLNISSIRMNTMQGRMEGHGGLIQERGGKLVMKASCSLDNLDIKELFFTFNEFQQDFITSGNLEGRIYGTMELSASLKPDFIPESESVWSEAAFRIENGELKDFEPLRNLSRFIEVSELEHVKFQTLQNTLIIKDSKVFIPAMDIRSSAFNISTSGEHAFDHHFEYKVGVNLSEILSRKARNKRENNEFAMLEKDGERINLFLLIWGTPDDFRIRYDRREAVQQIRRDIVTEKKELKSILNEELGLFRRQFNDSVQRQTEENPPPAFIFEWGDEEPVNEKDVNGRRNKSDRKQNNYRFEWE